MIDPNVDQAASALRDYWPVILRSLYEGFIEQGFSDMQAMFLTSEFMREQMKESK